MAGEKILLVDDIDDVRVSMQMVLEKAGYVTEGAADGPEALRKLYLFQTDLVLLDVMMPGMDGFAVCRRIRDMSDVPIIMLTAIGDEAEKVRALELGADGYVVKGTSMDELMARVRSTLRRAQSPPIGPPKEGYSDAAVRIDFKRKQVEVRGKRVELTPKEYDIFTALVQHDGSPMTTRGILGIVWDPDRDPELVKWHVTRLRRKIEEDPEHPKLIVTRRGYGYLYAAPIA